MKNTLFLFVCFMAVACAPTSTPFPPTQDSRAIETAIASKIYATLTASAPPKATEIPALPTKEAYQSLSPIDCDTKGKNEGATLLLSYDTLARKTESFSGRLVGYSGKVFQVMEQENDSTVLLISVRENSNDIIWLEYRGERLRQGDTIKFYGRVLGRQQYTSLAGQQLIVPKLQTLCSWVIHYSR